MLIQVLWGVLIRRVSAVACELKLRARCTCTCRRDSPDAARRGEFAFVEPI